MVASKMCRRIEMLIRITNISCTIEQDPVGHDEERMDGGGGVLETEVRCDAL